MGKTRRTGLAAAKYLASSDLLAPTEAFSVLAEGLLMLGLLVVGVKVPRSEKLPESLNL